MNKTLTSIISIIIIVAAVALLGWRYRTYLQNPWTRYGQVRANVVQIAPRVSGPVVDLSIADNQWVEIGDPLFLIDPRTFTASLEQAKAQYDQRVSAQLVAQQQIKTATSQIDIARASVLQSQSLVNEADAVIEQNKAEWERQKELLPQRATSKKAVEAAKANYEVVIEKRKAAVSALDQSEISLELARIALLQTQASAQQAAAMVRDAEANTQQAELNLAFTRVSAPVSGYVTNLSLRVGSQVVANQPQMAVIDQKSIWIEGFFKETQISRLRPGDEATVTLMAYPRQPLAGVVESIGWGIAQQDGSVGYEMLPTVSPTFDWIRLAQRLPVRIELLDVPDTIELRMGATASVLVRSGSGQNQP
jgi:multidrug resistance efflux pump